MISTTRRRPESATIIAIYHFVEAALLLLGVLGVGIGFAGVLFGAPNDPGVGVAYAVLGVVGIMLLILAGIDIAVGVGLLYVKNWARWAAIVLSVLRLPGVPVGTAIGGLTIYYLVQDEAKAAFEAE